MVVPQDGFGYHRGDLISLVIPGLCGDHIWQQSVTNARMNVFSQTSMEGEKGFMELLTPIKF